MSICLFKIAVLVSAMATLASCYRPLYQPEAVHDPMLYSKDQIVINGTANVVSAPIATPSFDIGLGYSPIERFGLKAALRSRNTFGGKLKFDQNGEQYYTPVNKGTSAEFGAGYYVPIDAKSYFSVYGNFMLGYNLYENYQRGTKNLDDQIRDNYRAFTIQPSFIFTTRYVNFATGLRFGVYQFHNIRVSAGSETFYKEFKIQEGVYHPILEPYYTMEAGKGTIKFCMQIGLSFFPTDIGANDENTYAKFGVGLNVRL